MSSLSLNIWFALSLPKSSSHTERQVFVSSFVHAWWASSSSSLDKEKTLKLSWHIPSPQTAMQVFEELREKHDWMLVPLGKWLMTCWWLGRVLSCLKLEYHYINNKPLQWALVELFLPWWDDHLLSEMIIHVDVAPLLNLLSTPAFHMSGHVLLEFPVSRR